MYEVIPPDDHFASMLDNVGHLEEETTNRPTALVLSEWDSVRSAVAAEKEVRALPVEREGGGRVIVNRSLFIKTSPVLGKLDAKYDFFGPNIQLGQFNMPDAESEFAVLSRDEVHRLEPFTTWTRTSIGPAGSPPSPGPPSSVSSTSSTPSRPIRASCTASRPGPTTRTT